MKTPRSHTFKSPGRGARNASLSVSFSGDEVLGVHSRLGPGGAPHQHAMMQQHHTRYVTPYLPFTTLLLFISFIHLISFMLTRYLLVKCTYFLTHIFDDLFMLMSSM